MGTGLELSTGENIGTALANPVSAGEKPRVFLFDVQGVRVVGTAEQPWFVAQDVCIALDIKETHRAIAGLDEDEKGRHTVTTLGGPQEMSTVNESGLYSLIFRSRKEQARVFRKWVTSEVLPALRKTGSYQVAALPAPSPAFRERQIPAEAPCRIEIIQRSDNELPTDASFIVAAVINRAIPASQNYVVLDKQLLAYTVQSSGFYPFLENLNIYNPQVRARAIMLLRRYFNAWLRVGDLNRSAVGIWPSGTGRNREYILRRNHNYFTGHDMSMFAQTFERAVDIVQSALVGGSTITVTPRPIADLLADERRLSPKEVAL